jgi:hypothetical protein
LNISLLQEAVALLVVAVVPVGTVLRLWEHYLELTLLQNQFKELVLGHIRVLLGQVVFLRGTVPTHHFWELLQLAVELVFLQPLVAILVALVALAVVEPESVQVPIWLAVLAPLDKVLLVVPQTQLVLVFILVVAVAVQVRLVVVVLVLLLVLVVLV